MKLDNSPQSLTTLKYLVETGDCIFELSFDIPRLHHIVFGSRYNLSFKEEYHSFIGETAYGR